MDILFRLYTHAFAENYLERIALGNYTNEDVLKASAGIEGGERLFSFLKNPSDEDILKASAILANKGKYSSATAMITRFLTRGKNSALYRGSWEIIAYCAANQGEIKLLQKALTKALDRKVKEPPLPDVPIIGFLNYGKPIAFFASSGFLATKIYSTYYFLKVQKDTINGSISLLLSLNYIRGNISAIDELRKEYYRKEALKLLRKEGIMSSWLFR